jgi:hypothetical protein
MYNISEVQCAISFMRTDRCRRCECMCIARSNKVKKIKSWYNATMTRANSIYIYIYKHIVFACHCTVYGMI